MTMTPSQIRKTLWVCQKQKTIIFHRITATTVLKQIKPVKEKASKFSTMV